VETLERAVASADDEVVLVAHSSDGPTGFAPMPLVALPFPSVVVACREDRYVSLERARSYAKAWGSTFVDVGAAGHINSASNLGTWPAGYALLESLRRGTHRDASP
jgi:predicted alpha/beta hydrolase family esterase